MAKEKDPRLKRAGVSGFNTPKATPNHKNRSYARTKTAGKKNPKD